MAAYKRTTLPDPKKRAMLLAALHTAQEQYGWLSQQAIQEVAEQLRLTPGQVHATASFYSMFKLEPQGKYHLQVCEGLSCYLVGGAEPLIDYIRRRLNLDGSGVSADGRFSLEVVQCLAACDLAPVIRVNDELYGNMDADKIEALLNELADSRALPAVEEGRL